MMEYSLKNYLGKKVLITGDTGFKGSWLAIWLLKLGARVIGFGLPPKNPEDNFTISGLDSKILHIDGDIRDLNSITRTIEEQRPDFVFHLAAQALVIDSYNDPCGTFNTNVQGTLNVLEAIRKCPSVKVGIFVTSDKCYDNKEWMHGYRESDPLGGNDPYSASKGAAEIVISSYIHSFFNSENTPSIASVRAGNVIGGGDWSQNRIIPDCIRALINDKPITIRNPKSVRPWQHVLEPLYGYLLLGSVMYDEGKEFSGPWNFGPQYQNAAPVEDLVHEILHQWGGGTFRIDSPEERKKESTILMLDISKAVHLLGWSPVLSLKQAVRFTLDEYRIKGWSKEEIFYQRSAHIDEYMKLREMM
jgi:CDP-glucose 4,6-dehydratase